jgi:hypothetical protein
MTEKTREENAVNAAEFALEVERQRKIALLKAGKLSPFEAESLTAELCAVGDAGRRRVAEQAERDSREIGARLRAGRP